MDTLALALALMMDGRAPVVPSIVSGMAYTGAQRDSVTLVAPERVAALDTRAQVATKTPSIWGD